MELGGVGNEGPLRPPPARITTETGLYAGRDVALHNVRAQGVASGGAVGAQRLYATHLAAQGGLHHDPFAHRKAGVVLHDFAQDLVPHHERRRGYGREVRRALGGEGAEVRTADAGEERAYAHPVRGGKFRFCYLFELQRGEAARVETLYALRARTHEGVAGDGLSLLEGEHAAP